ncbi:uncharacterized protein LOC124163912 [Ischnura elegans]|uniref:uncharacterized protein LOC124163912 n=1 Tax=Ischnura elegans TaxID=197161 RepID=UPI001ED893D4|nr:uncharacterized protein LOC124163912 [Ischnura elegans]
MSALREKVANNPGNVIVQPFFCCTIIESMQKDIVMLQRELIRLSPLEEQYKESLKEFLQLTQLVDSKLYALWTAASSLEATKSAKVKEFVQSISSMWKSGDEEVRKTLKNTHLVSQSYPDIPLDEFIQATHKHYAVLRRHLDSVPRHARCNHIAYSKNSEMIHLLNHLSQMDYILQYYIALCRVNPFLRSLGQAIDQYIIQEGYLATLYGPTFAEKVQPGASTWKNPASGPSNLSKAKSELSAFHSLTKLLTGELLGHQPLDPLTGLEPLVRDSKLEVYLVPSTTVNSSDKSTIWKNLFEAYQPVMSNSAAIKRVPDSVENSVPLNFTKEALSGKENIGTKERVIHTIKLPYKGPILSFRNKKHKLRNVMGSSVDTDLQPIKIPRIEGALLPPLP